MNHSETRELTQSLTRSFVRTTIENLKFLFPVWFAVKVVEFFVSWFLGGTKV